MNNLKLMLLFIFTFSTITDAVESNTQQTDLDCFKFRDDSKTILKGYNCDSTDIRIPDGVVTISPHALFNRGLTSVKIPNTVTSIQHGAFSNNNIAKLIIPDSVTVIDQVAFANYNLTELILPASLKRIGSSAFRNNNLGSLYIPYSVSCLGWKSFAENPLSEVFVSNFVKNIVKFKHIPFKEYMGSVFDKDVVVTRDRYLSSFRETTMPLHMLSKCDLSSDELHILNRVEYKSPKSLRNDLVDIEKVIRVASNPSKELQLKNKSCSGVDREREDTTNHEFSLEIEDFISISKFKEKNRIRDNENISFKYNICSVARDLESNYKLYSTDCSRKITKSIVGNLILNEDLIFSRNEHYEQLNKIISSADKKYSYDNGRYGFRHGDTLYTVDITLPAEANPVSKETLEQQAKNYSNSIYRLTNYYVND